MNCDPLPKSTFTKAYYQEQLKNQYDWNVGDEFSYQETKYLYEVGGDMRLFFSNETSGHGKAWMEKNVGEIDFKINTPGQKVVSFAGSVFRGEWDYLPKGGRSASFVPGMNTIHLYDGFANGEKLHVAHEIAHVIDNTMGGQKATFVGGGPGDELSKFQGGNPSVCPYLRFINGRFNKNMPGNNYFKKGVNSGYGNSASAEYFAESLSLMIYSPLSVPSSAVLWLGALIDLTK